MSQPVNASVQRDDTSVATLRAHCRSIGYQAFDGGQGAVNDAPVFRTPAMQGAALFRSFQATYRSLTMSSNRIARSHRPNHDVPEEREPPELPVEPDEGLIPPVIPDDPEHERLIDPETMQPQTGPRRTKAPSSTPGLPLPHERDESSNFAAVVPDPVIVQAKRDIDAGMVDTDMRATPGLDAKLRECLVPGPGGKPTSGR